jgi:ribosome hibernation promoting factor
MKLTVTTRRINNNQDPEKLKTYAIKKSKRIERYLSSDVDMCEVKFVLSSEKFRDNAEISISSRNLKATSSFETTDMYTAIDNAIDIIINQLKKETDKKIKAKRRSTVKNKEGAVETRHQSESGSGSFTNIKIKKLPPKPMTVEEASLQLRESDTNFITFRNSANNYMNVLYIDSRGQITLIEP